MQKIKIKWHGHSCFTISREQYRIVLDPYESDSVPGLSPLSLTAEQVLCSHDHGDHHGVSAVQITESGSPGPFQIQVIDTWHDDAQGALRGPNRIHILEAGGLKIAHMGDLGCDLTDEQAEKLMNLDGLLIPTGGFYTIDSVQAKKIVDRLSPRVIVPMHYRSEGFGFPEIARLEDFTALCDNVVYYKNDELEIGFDTPVQTAVLQI